MLEACAPRGGHWTARVEQSVACGGAGKHWSEQDMLFQKWGGRGIEKSGGVRNQGRIAAGMKTLWAPRSKSNCFQLNPSLTIQ